MSSYLLTNASQPARRLHDIVSTEEFIERTDDEDSFDDKTSNFLIGIWPEIKASTNSIL